jgi:hypothetical protein
MKFISAKQWIAVDAILESSLLPVEVSSSPPSLCSLSMCCDLLRCHHRSRDCVLIQMTFLRRRATSWYPPPPASHPCSLHLLSLPEIPRIPKDLARVPLPNRPSPTSCLPPSCSSLRSSCRCEHRSLSLPLGIFVTHHPSSCCCLLTYRPQHAQGRKGSGRVVSVALELCPRIQGTSSRAGGDIPPEDVDHAEAAPSEGGLQLQSQGRHRSQLPTLLFSQSDGPLRILMDLAPFGGRGGGRGGDDVEWEPGLVLFILTLPCGCGRGAVVEAIVLGLPIDEIDMSDKTLGSDEA